jgi:hypothetical protein
MMKRYKKEIDGKTVIKNRQEIVIRRDGRVTYNPTEEMVLADGWVEYVAPEPRPIPEKVLIERARRRKLDELHRYDESNEVNDCIIVYQGEEIHYWANKTERNDLKNAVRDCIAMGRDTYRLDLRDKGVSIVLPCVSLSQMLSALEIYAIDCYNRTTDHEFAIKSLTTKDEIEAYDFTIGYPSIPRFEV